MSNDNLTYTEEELAKMMDGSSTANVTPTLLTLIAEEKGVDPSLIKNASDAIAFHESYDPSTGVGDNASMKQFGSGPGRGRYQYEIGGPDKSAAVARRRALSAYSKYNIEQPQWLVDAGDDIDPSLLSTDQQFELFLGDHRMRPNSDFALLNQMPLEDWWGQFHQTQNDPVKKELFTQHYDMLVSKKKEQSSNYRADGTKKSQVGFLGPVENKVEGGTMTEVSIGTEVNGEEMQIPTMVPTLSKEEVELLSNMQIEGNAKNIPDSIVEKAIAHAQQRIADNKSPFYSDTKDEVKADPFKVGDTNFVFLDGDTIADITTGEKIRFRDIDLAEVDKVRRESGYEVGEAAGSATRQYVAELANKYGYTVPKATKKKDKYGRAIGDLYDEEGNSFTDFLLSTGIAAPTFIGDSTITMSDESYDRLKYGEGLRALRDSKGEKTDYDVARDLIRVAALEPTGGVPIGKMDAFNEQEYAAFPELFSGVVLRNKNATFDNRSKTPLSQSYNAGLSAAGNSFQLAGAALADTLGMDDTQAWLQGKADYSRSKLANAPKVRLDYKDVNFSSLDQVSEYIGANIAMSLPFMGVTLTSMLAAPFTFNASLSVPVAMYSGMILEDMEGDLEDKSYGIAIAGGAVAAALDRIGLKGALGGLGPQSFMTKEAREIAVEAILKAEGAALLNANKILGRKVAQALTRKEAEIVLTRASKRELAGYVKDVAAFTGKQLTKTNILKQFIKRAAVSGASEGVTEVLQELTQYTASVLGSEKTWDWEEIEERMISAGVAGSTIGGSFSVPSTVWQAGQWYDAGVAKSPYDNRFDDTVAGYKAEAAAANKTRKGVEPDLDEAVSSQWQTANSQEALNRFNNDPDAFERRKAAAEARKAAKPATQRLKDALSDPIASLRTALDTRMDAKLLNKSKTARIIYDIFGGRKLKTHGGVDFHSDKVINFMGFEGTLRPIDDVLNEFQIPRGSYGKRKEAVSNLVNKFYKAHIAPITRYNTDGTPRSNEEWITPAQLMNRIDWANLDPEFKSNSLALKGLISDLYAVDNKMHNDISIRQQGAGVSVIGKLQDHIFRSKSFLKSTIGKNKEEFVNLLVSNKGMRREDAASVTEAILDNPEINNLDDAFDLTKGGLAPKTHKRRSLDISDDPAFSKFQQQDIFNNLEYGMKSAARYMTITKFIGPKNKILQSMLNEVYRELRGDSEIDSAPEIEAREAVEDLTLNLSDLINADSGNYKRIESAAVRGAQRSLTLVGVLTMLPLAAVSSVVELALTIKGSSLENLHKNVGGFGIILGQEMFQYFKEVGRLVGLPVNTSTFDSQIKSKKKRLGEDIRQININDPRSLVQRAGMMSQKTGAATLVGVTETSEFTQALMDSFFKMIGLQGITNATRTIRASMYNDFLIENLDILHQSEITNEAAEARKMLEYIGIPVDTMLRISNQLRANSNTNTTAMNSQQLQKFKAQEAAVTKEYVRQFDNGLISYINASVPMPDAMGRPLFYSNPHYALFTQFQGFISKFTANHIPAMYDMVKTGTPGMKFSMFASVVTMLMLGYASQYLKDLIKFGEGSPYLSNEEKYLRALYSTGLLGTTERIISSDLFFPLYEQRSKNAAESVWNLVSGEAPASNIVTNILGLGHGVLEDDPRATLKSGMSLTPFSFLKHRTYDGLVDNGWISGE